MTVGRKLKRNIFIDTDIDCQNCGCWQRVCTWNGECDNLEPMTNEEYLKTCTTEQLAEWMALRLNQGILLALRMKYHCDGVDAVREWLKEKHT